LNEKVMAGESEEEAARRKMRDRVKTRKDKVSTASETRGIFETNPPTPTAQFFYLINIMLEDGGDNVVGKIFSFIHPKKKEVAISKATKNISSINDSKRLKRIKNRRKVVKKTGDLHHCLEVSERAFWKTRIRATTKLFFFSQFFGSLAIPPASTFKMQLASLGAVGGQHQFSL
tara:strand:- start:2132 stop:2653 length:522 start_codon:yes stop_codon:yes gene_type:complete